MLLSRAYVLFWGESQSVSWSSIAPARFAAPREKVAATFVVLVVAALCSGALCSGSPAAAASSCFRNVLLNSRVFSGPTSVEVP